jgi:dTMP kinase
MAFIVFEGGEGTGKSTQISLLVERLSSKGKNCVFTREPGGTPLAEQIRSLFKAVNEHGDAPLPVTELLMVSAARAQHVQTFVKPALQSGKWVVCDRFVDSSYVYQGMRAGVPKGHIDTVTEIALGGVFPNLVLVLHVSREEARLRMQKRGNVAADRLDAESEAIHAVIDNGFLRLVDERVPWFGGRVPLRVLVDAEGSVADVHKRICAAVSQHLEVAL